MTNKSILLSDLLELDLAEAIANLELLKKSLNLQQQSLQDERAKLAAEKQQSEDEKAKLQIKVSQLESDKSRLEVAVSHLESDKSRLEVAVSHLESDKGRLEAEQRQSKYEIQGLNDKIRELGKQSNGKKIHMIPARQLSIEWADTPQYWTWKSSPDSTDGEVAELLNVCWLEIYGRILLTDLTPNVTNAVYLVFKLTENHQGFYSPPSEAFVGIMLGERSTRNVMLVAQGQGQHPVWRQDGWMEVELGQYYVRGNQVNKNDILEMSLKEIGGGQWKSGLVVRGIEVRPV